jgi:hypothetical protein
MGPTSRLCVGCGAIELATCDRRTNDLGKGLRSARNGAAGNNRPHSFVKNPIEIPRRESPMNNIVYIVGLVVIVIAVLSFFGLR